MMACVLGDTECGITREVGPPTGSSKAAADQQQRAHPTTGARGFTQQREVFYCTHNC